MAQVKIPSLLTGNQITTTDINDFINSVNSISGNVNSDNVRDEGIDRRNLGLQSVQIISGATQTPTQTGSHFISSGSYTIPTQANFCYDPILSSTGTRIQVSGIQCDNGDKILVHCSFSFQTLTRSNNNIGGPEVRFKIFETESQGSTFGGIPGSERRFNNFLEIDGQSTNVDYSCTIVCLLEASTTSSGVNDYTFDLRGFAMPSLGSNVAITGILRNCHMFYRVIKK
tara:strand:- start:339 stop:1022 length:684 start_codon:yes stop_codon:yes gene_type:complete